MENEEGEPVDDGRDQAKGVKEAKAEGGPHLSEEVQLSGLKGQWQGF